MINRLDKYIQQYTQFGNFLVKSTHHLKKMIIKSSVGEPLNNLDQDLF